ncbi:MAG: hypothetical protein M1827_006212 [Pycnora praestabilis]|nr:MAG: hypothetical protein M1827_006212 [Pycnora praestabilis]
MPTSTGNTIAPSLPASNGGARQPNTKPAANTTNGSTNFPPPKTDKPRPHVCGTCSRSFARLEHLKRHERSHTKEKPFECPECTRCFARRDLLLRHQQKLHMTATPSSRPRSGRRESTSSTAGSGLGRVRKNSVANSAVGGSGGVGASAMRPRANTISHVDNATLGMIAAANSSIAGSRIGNSGANHSHHSSLGHMSGPGGFEFRGMSTALGQHGNHHGLPKLETGLNMNMGGGLRTAPPYGGLGSDFEIDGLMFSGPSSTINPAQLHFSDSPQSLAMGTPTSPYHQTFPGMSATQAMMDDEDHFDWMNGFENQLSFAGANEHAIDGSSPSAISTGSQSGISEVMLDGSNNPPQTSGVLWQNSMMPPAQAGAIPFSMDLAASNFSEIIPPPGTVSPNSLHAQNGIGDSYLSTPPRLTTLSPSSVMPGMSNQFFHPPMVYSAGTPSTSSASMSGSARQSSVTSVSTDSITDSTRSALLTSLSQPSPFGHSHRKYSLPSVSSPLSPAFTARSSSFSASLPSTRDLQRYVGAYIQYFHPHMPFLHIASLNFDSPPYTNHLRPSSGHTNFSQSGITGGGGCLILAMAAIGALYESDNAASKELFESAKKMIQLYLEERRKADMSAALSGSNAGSENTAHNTPLWLVQAMLLNVVYGHNCGDKTAADIASTHCAALVSLARAAELARPLPTGSLPQSSSMQFFRTRANSEDIQMGDDGFGSDQWSLGGSHDLTDDQTEWHNWKITEERKRTLYAVFILSSLLVSAYNHAPALTNSEIRLDLPCDEDLWAAESAPAWYARGGAVIAGQTAIPFATALSTLLTASQRQQQHHQLSQNFHQPFGSGVHLEDLPESDLKPSTFGCLVLINALHNYIWETRQRHHGRQWTTQETEAMHAHIEPALKAWQAAWASNPHHSLERPNPFGMGPLSADSIPLLDLAYVRLFVNLGRSKEAFWQRDYDGMADELARGSEIVQHGEHSPSSGTGSSGSDATDSLKSAHSNTESPDTATSSPNLNAIKTPTPNHMIPSLISQVHSSGQTSKRERHLRKAAFYAADSLSMSDKLGVTFADFTSRELPLQSAMCAFDCAQVLAEWVSTVQERVGRYLGILGKDDIDYGQVPGIMLLEDEDCKLLEKITEVLNSAEVKMTYEIGGMGAMAAMSAMNGLPSAADCGYGSKILRVTAYMLDKAAVWPVTRLMARSLETQATHMKTRAENSVSAQE